MYRREAIFAEHEINFTLNSNSRDEIMIAGFYSKWNNLTN